MKSPTKNVIMAGLTLLAFFGGLVQGNSQTTLSVDSTKPWIGFMNVFALPGDGGGYMFGSAWGTAALRANFDVTGTNFVTLTPNTNVYNSTDAYWVKPDGSGNKNMDASFYVQDDTLAGQTLTFSGTCISDTLVSPFTSVAFIKDFAPDYSFSTPVTATLVTGQTFSITLSTSPGDHIQYGFETIGPDVNPGLLDSYGKVVIEVNNVDPSLSAVNSQALVEGQNASFKVTATGTTPLSYQWTFISPTVTNILSNGGRISGATTNQLVISGVTGSDAGTYSVTVTNSRGTNAANATLVVTPLAQAQTNLLIDPSFESSTFAPTPTAGWVNFGGSAFANTNDFYFLSATPVSVYDGTNCVQVYASGTYNGVDQDRPALPGQVYTASAWFLTPSADQISGSNVCYLEVQFRDASDTPLVQYASSMVDTNFPTDTWINLSPTNVHAGDFVTSLGTSPFLVAPPGTVKVRTQITYHSLGGVGSVYVDALSLRLREPVVAASAIGPNIQLSFPTLYGPVYQVLYKNHLTDASWTLLTAVTGDGTVKTVSDPRALSARYYIVNTQ